MDFTYPIQFEPSQGSFENVSSEGLPLSGSQIRENQDRAYQESLKLDQEKEAQNKQREMLKQIYKMDMRKSRGKRVVLRLESANRGHTDIEFLLKHPLKMVFAFLPRHSKIWNPVSRKMFTLNTHGHRTLRQLKLLRPTRLLIRSEV